jgi:hypothetical protein
MEFDPAQIAPTDRRPVSAKAKPGISGLGKLPALRELSGLSAYLLMLPEWREARVYALSGREVLRVNKGERVTLPELPEGLYFLNITGVGNSYSTKINHWNKP